MSEPVTYRISYEDYLSFSRLHQIRSLKPFVIFMVVLVGVIGVIAWLGGAPEVAFGGVIGAFVAITVLPLVGRYIVIPWQTKRSYREYSMMHEDMTLSLTSDEFRIEQQSGNVAARWDRMAKWDENEDVFLIYPTRNLAYILPKSDIGSARIDYAREQLRASGLMNKGTLRK
ncbi:MAG: YcxB family protein [Pseudomonadota bacterium]